MRLQGKVAIVTGAARGIGCAYAERFLREGASVVLADVDAGAGGETAQTLAGLGPTGFVATDITSPESVAACARAAVDRFGGLDVLVNNAGAERMVPLTATDDETWDSMMDVNARGVFLAAQHAIPRLLERGGGAIVNVASAAAFRGSPGLAAYSAAKAAVVSMTKCLAAELAGSGIRVNAVAPGLIDTPMGRRAMDMVGGREAMMRLVAGALSVKRPGEPQEIARAVVFLASDLASYVTGVTLPVDGGMTAL